MNSKLFFSKRINLILFIILFGWTYGQTTIAFNGAEDSGTTLTTSSNNFSSSTTNTGTPADRIKNGAKSFQKVNGTATLITDGVSVSGYTAKFVELWNAGVSTNSTNGIDGTDKLEVYVSETSTFNSTPDVTLTGGTNSRWGMSGTAVITTTAGTPISASQGNATQTGANARSKIVVNIPDAWSNVFIKIVSLSNAAEEVWCVDDIAIKGTFSSTTPLISATPATLNGFTYVQNNGPSTEQSFSVSGLNLTSNVTVTAPTNYEISSTTGAGFTNALTYAQTGGSLASSPVYVRLKSGLNVASYNENITVSSTGATDVSVSLAGNVTPPPANFRSKTTGNWSSVATWEFSTDNVVWADAINPPSLADNTISIESGHTVTINSTVMADQILIKNGGVLSTGGQLTVNDGSGDDVVINDGGKLIYTALPTISGSATVRVTQGGVLSLEGSGLTGASSVVHTKTIYDNNSVLEWNAPTQTPAASGVTFFPNADVNTIPVLRFNTPSSGTIGGANTTTINGKLEIATGVTLTLSGTGIKIVRNGILGAGTLSQAGAGKIIFSGDNSEIGGTSTLILGTSGFEVSGSNFLVSGTLDSNNSTSILVNNVVNNGNILIKNGGNFIQTTGSTYAGSGTFKVDKNTTTDTVGKYAFFSSPVAGQNIYGIYGATQPAFAMTYNTATDYYDVVANPTTAAAGIGYSLKVPAVNAPVSFTGSANNGDITTTLTLSGNNYNMVGNPYPSNIKLSDFYNLNSTNIGSTLYFWDNKSNSVTTQNNNTTVNIGFATYNAASQTWAAAPTSTQPTGDVASIGQGFIVEATGVSLTFNNSLRSRDTGSFFNKTTLNSTDKYWLQLSTPYNSNTTLAVTYGGGATNSFEKNDSKLIGLGSDAFYSRSGTDKFAIQGRADFTDNDVVDLGNKHFENGSFTISLLGKEGIFSNGQAIYLHDKELNTYTNLQNGNYVFATAQGEFANRFEVVYQLGTLGTSEVKGSGLKFYQDNNEYVIESSSRIDEIQILDASGRVVKQANSKENTVRFTIESKGMYFVNIKTGNNIITKKVVK